MMELLKFIKNLPDSVLVMFIIIMGGIVILLNQIYIKGINNIINDMDEIRDRIDNIEEKVDFIYGTLHELKGYIKGILYKSDIDNND